jgi:hypothetical protein
MRKARRGLKLKKNVSDNKGGESDEVNQSIYIYI